jgi:hypothetical protein
MADSGQGDPLGDFLLQDEIGTLAPPVLHAGEPVVAATAATRTAPLAARLTSAAADTAAVLLLCALALLAARLATGTSPRPAGIPWILGFLLFLSFFTTVPALVLFGRTVGMALSDLSARGGAGEGGLPADAALRRWAGGIATAATGGLLLLWTVRDPQNPTPADRLSGHSLTID